MTNIIPNFISLPQHEDEKEKKKKKKKKRRKEETMDAEFDNNTLIVFPEFSQHLIQKRVNNQDDMRIPIPGNVDLSSIFVTNINNESIPFVFINKNTNDNFISSLPKCTVIKNNTNFNGILIKNDNDNIHLLTDDNKLKIINNYDIISMDLPSDLNIDSYISINVVDETIITSYIKNDLTWASIIDIYLTNAENMMFVLKAVIKNKSKITYDTNLILSTGELKNGDHLVESSMSRAAFARTPDFSDDVNTTIDIRRYELGNVHLADAHLYVNLRSDTVPYEKIYMHNTNKNKVTYGYRFITPDFLPASKVNIYDSEKIFMNFDNIKEHRTDESVKITAGESTVVQCKTVVIGDVNSYDRNDQYSERMQTIKTEVQNFSPSPALLILSHYVGKMQIVNTNCQTYTRTNDGYLEWSFLVEPSTRISEGVFTSQTFECALTMKPF